MNDIRHHFDFIVPRERRMRYIVFVSLVLMVATAVFSFTLIPQTKAIFDCTGNSWVVANESDLNGALNCYNAKTTANDYMITFSQNISLTTSTNTISNTFGSVALVVDGAEFTIDGQDMGGIRPFFIDFDTPVTLQNLTITGGNTTDFGGGIHNDGNLTLHNSTVINNTTDGDGGGIYNTGTFTLINSTLNDNLAGFGGGIYNSYTLIISNSTLANNSAELGSGLYNDNTGIGILSNSTLIRHLADYGGGIYNSGTLTLTRSTLNGNSAHFNGGGIRNLDTLTLSNNTLSGNSANSEGGGIYNSGLSTLRNNTLSDNSADSAGGGGVYNSSTGTLTLSNNIIANSISGGDCTNDALSPITDNGHNIVEDNSCGFTGGVDPLLGPLQDNGGFTPTHALLFGSPAIDAGDTTLTSDQRGIPRPVGLADDIGAYEFFDISDFVYLPIILK